ncbi:MAG: hypothetical protein JWM27_1461 [Gemmatimonadetes bacterium]|jgi:hypothetical protein|nr:hypothetical protein [Gemmatimonadota bacterium]
MSDRLSLDLDQLAVESFPTAPSEPEPSIMPVDSWPAVCTCIGICQGTADVYCSGGCPPFAAAVKQPFDAAAR